MRAASCRRRKPLERALDTIWRPLREPVESQRQQGLWRDNYVFKGSLNGRVELRAGVDNALKGGPKGHAEPFLAAFSRLKVDKQARGVLTRSCELLCGSSVSFFGFRKSALAGSRFSRFSQERCKALSLFKTQGAGNDLDSRARRRGRGAT